MKFYFIRHGQTEYNLEKRIQGYSVDSPLTSKGIADAKKVGNVLRDVAFDAVYVSPQERAVDTCRYILKENKHSIPSIKKDSRLKEMNFGCYDGKLIEQFKVDGYYDIFTRCPNGFDSTSINGEDYMMLTERVMSFLIEAIDNADKMDCILVVAHSLTLTVLLQYLAGKSVADYRRNGILANTSISCLNVRTNTYKLECYNFISK